MMEQVGEIGEIGFCCSRQQLRGTSAIVPNGIALQRDGSFPVANLGPDGGVWHPDAQGNARPWLHWQPGGRLAHRWTPTRATTPIPRGASVQG